MTQARLSDLYRRGAEVTVSDDEAGLEVTVWMSKLNPVEAKDAGRKAAAARARTLLFARDPESDSYMEALGEVMDMSDEHLIDTIIAPDVFKKEAATREELAAGDEWAKDDYLIGLMDSWREEYMEIWVKDADPDWDEATLADWEEKKAEALRIRAELTRFEDLVRESVNGETEALRRANSSRGREDLEKGVLARLFENKSNEEWLNTYNRWQVYYATRENENRSKRYFQNVQEVIELEPDVYIPLLRSYRALEVEPFEGKSLQETPAS